jgi:hypothetical protein
MNFTAFASLVLFAGAGLASATSGSSYVTEKCHELVAGVVNEGHSHFEVAALCRARFPSNLCREGLNRLGSQPWSAETMRSACGSWDAEWKALAVGRAPARRTQDLVEAIDYTMEKKHELGICKGLDLTGCLQFKAKKYPEIVNNVTRIVGEISDASAKGKGSQGEQPPPGVDTPPAAAPAAPAAPAASEAPAAPAAPAAAEPPAEQPAEPVVAEWADFHKTLNFSGRQSHLPWAVAGFAAGMGAGALLVARATAGLRRTRNVISTDGTHCMAAE